MCWYIQVNKVHDMMQLFVPIVGAVPLEWKPGANIVLIQVCKCHACLNLLKVVMHHSGVLSDSASC